jgi:cell division protein FtsQ
MNHSRVLHHTQAPELPADVRWMNRTAAGLMLLWLLLVLILGVHKLMRHPSFDIRSIVVEGEVSRNSESIVRTNALPKLTGTFFNISLGAAQDAFEAIPWVRRAVVTRVWPWQLKVRLQEHHAAAIWAPDENTEELVNTEGEVFEANVGDVEDENLPVFSGPAANSVQILRMYRSLEALLPRGEHRITALALSGRGSWRAELNSGARLELGRGSDEEVIERTRQFIATLPLVSRGDLKDVEAADMRHREGYALRLRAGAATQAASGADH